MGRIRLVRGYVCGTDARFPADVVRGGEGYLTTAAAPRAVLAGVRQSCARAASLRAELSGWNLDDETICQATHQAARQAAAARPARGDVRRFTAAAGALAVPRDAGTVNTTAGWREVKVAVFANREPGEPATPAAWAERALPTPTVRTVVAALEEAGALATRVRFEADRLGVTAAADVTVLGDGAAWVWNLAAAVVPQATGVLALYHAVAHVAGAARAVWGAGTPARTAHLDAGRSALLRDGKAGLERWLGEAFATVSAGVPTDALLEWAAYFAQHPTRLGYAERLARGRSLGSGLVEGRLHQRVNLRRKRTGARGRVEHVGPRVELLALADSPEWCPYWTAV